jgi:hypothetical protein
MNKEMTCEWCGAVATTGSGTVYWELPDGTRAEIYI